MDYAEFFMVELSPSQPTPGPELVEVETASGDTTILFTDIEGSTRLWEQEPQRMSQALACHDAAARAAVESNGGVIVKMTGDGLYAVFADPVDGLNATLMLQQSLSDPAATHGLTLRMRCGLHAGALERRDNDYFGPPVNRTARIMGVAHGGQILVSQAVVDKLGARLPPEISLRDLGGVRLKDLTAPERVYQIVHPSLRQDFPALRSLEATPNNLPQQLTSFFGREREIAAAQALLKSGRLLTLLGMGGLGKTRLSLQIAADELDAYPDGVWFLDLAPIQDPSLVPSVAAQTLGVQEEPGRPLTQTLCAHLKSRQSLLIFDNCEHLISACADLVNALLRAAPDVRILSTSREALRVPGEQTYPVLPLAVPDRNAGLEALAKSDAVQLFLDRARLHQPNFVLSEREAPSVAELCARLEGIPLALELAAARMRTLSVADINVRLRDRFKLLTGGGRVLLERQQTLRALVEWSYDLLSEHERVLFDRLSVFVGGFDLVAAEAICGAEPLLVEDVPNVLSSLVDKSLVTGGQTDGDAVRYRTLETIRDYARERLGQRGEQVTLAKRHCDYFFIMVKAGNEGLQGPEQAEWTRRLETDLDNMRAGVALALEGGVDPILAVKFEIALMGFRTLRGYVSEGRNYVRAALALPAVQASDFIHAHGLYVGAALAIAQSDNTEAGRMLEACLALRRGMTDSTFEIASTLSTLSLVRLHAGDAKRAREGEEEALAIFRQVGDRTAEAIALLHLGEICIYTGDHAQACQYLEPSLDIARAVAYKEIESDCERMLGQIALEGGDLSAARARFIHALEVCRDGEDKRGAAMATWWTGKADLADGDLDAARSKLDAVLRTFQSFEMYAEMLGCLQDHAELAQFLGRTADAVRLYAAVEAFRERLALARPQRRIAQWDKALAAARAALGDAAFDGAWAEGKAWELEQATRHALAAGRSVAALPRGAPITKPPQRERAGMAYSRLHNSRLPPA